MNEATPFPFPQPHRPYLHTAAEPPLEVSAAAAPERTRSTPLTRVLAASALLGVAAGLLALGYTAYWAITDSYVAPMSLSPDSDLAVANKAKLTQLEVEQARTRTKIEELDAELEGLEVERARLTTLREQAKHALPWTANITSLEVSAGAAAKSTLGQARSVLVGMIARQQKLVEEARANLDLGIIPRADLQKEEQALSQLNLALLENDRVRVQIDLSSQKAILGQRSLAGRQGAPAMPEVMANEGLLVRLELELLHVEGQQRAKRSERRAQAETAASLDELAAQLKSRPFFQAVKKELDLAFVPYSQLEGVQAGARVLNCVFGLFACEEVGAVAEVVPGEVALLDPWGKQSRGQYAVLNLRNREAARSATLRVREPARRAPPASAAASR
jgi:hypothetical protein